MILSSILSSTGLSTVDAPRVLQKAWKILLLSTFVSGAAHAAVVEYRIQFTPSPSSGVSGYTLHIGSEPGFYPGEVDLGSLPVSGGTIIYTLQISHADDLFFAVRAYGGQGATSVFSNEMRVSGQPQATPPPNPPSDPTSGSGSNPPGDQFLFYESFDGYVRGDDPAGWLDTGASNALTESSELFTIRRAPGGGHALSTRSSASNIHSHLLTAESGSWSNYELFGRMRIDDPDAGIGVTVLSDYPHSDSYLRLRRWAQGDSFRLSPHAEASAGSCLGSTNTGVVPRADTWYWFRFRTVDEGAATRVLASVWEEGTDLPADWQIDCLWSAWESPVGRPGVWSRGPDTKMWDNLGAVTIDEAVGSGGTNANDPSRLYAEDFESLALEADPLGWIDTRRNYGSTTSPTLFEVAAAPGGGRALATRSTDTNIHSHYLGSNDEARGWTDYVYSGRMLAASSTGGVGVTLYSDYPENDQYIRLRYWPGHSEFRISNRATNDSSCVGTRATGVGRIPGVWYAFKLRAIEQGNDIRVQAKVWPENESEPTSWQGDCTLADPAAFAGGGAPGLWSTGGGAKYWDDLVVEEVINGTQ